MIVTFSHALPAKTTLDASLSGSFIRAHLAVLSEPDCNLHDGVQESLFVRLQSNSGRDWFRFARAPLGPPRVAFVSQHRHHHDEKVRR